MKNFPHQFNKLDRFTASLVVLGNLAAIGADLSDDGVVGDALARARVYTFRGAAPGSSVSRLLVAEHRKRPASQGTRTMARELRKTFMPIGLLVNQQGTLSLTPDALRLIGLRSDPFGDEARVIWRRAFHALTLADDQGNVSRPYEIMLRLAGERPGIKKGLLGLALEAKDDSEAEFARLLRVVGGGGSPWQAINVSRFQWDNSSKILPAVAQQLGELELIKGDAYLGLSDPLVPREEHGRSGSGAVRSRRRLYDPTRTRGRRGRGGKTSIRIHDPDLAGARYQEHEACLGAFSALIPSGFVCWEADYDLLIAAKKDILLVEVKTIREDASIQMRLGLGQLLYYEHFDVRPAWPQANIHRVLLADRALDPELTGYLDAHEVGVVMHNGGNPTWKASPRAKRQLARFGVKV